MKDIRIHRIYPASERRKHNITQDSVRESVDYIEEYASESISSTSRQSVLSDDVSVRSESPPIKIIKTSHSLNHPLNAQSSLHTIRTISKATPSFRSYIVSPISPLYKTVSWIPIKTRPSNDVPPPRSSLKANKHIRSCPTIPSSILLPVITFGLGIAACIIVILAVLLALKNDSSTTVSSSYTSSSCADNCMMSITPFRDSTVASWPFDSSLSDENNVYSALYSNPPNVPYDTGNVGNAVVLSSSQYLYASTHFMNLSYRSWTVEGWLLLSSVSGTRGIFSQCQSASTTDQCLTLSIQNQRLHLGFTNDDLDGSTILTTSSVLWRHVAFVYDYTMMRQSIYLDGVLEATTSASGLLVGPYKGQSGNIFIGRTDSGDYFEGRIDQLQVSERAKSACEILNDATLTAYYAFDIGASYLDSSLNYFHGISNLLITLPGRVNYAYSFQYEYSYFQSQGFTAYQTDEPFSVSLWVNPFVVTGGTLIHLSTNIDGSSDACFDLLGLSSSGRLIGQLYESYDCCVCCVVNPLISCPCRGLRNVAGPTMIVNTWTHIVLTYSRSNGLALYTNGTLRGVTDAFSSFPEPAPDYDVRPYMIVGNQRIGGGLHGCLGSSPSVSSGSYRGLIDELRIYSRELTKTEICSLFHV
ncbi:unnamed protein product [Adineta ricciae]|uniref:LamG-like jellyroll fold domain-containing protein n=1 Tax=Adineta ricciae TaxID=249248 RepID=A0A814DDA6_ADIRI|nr:unnamed protein product [Adineta ricciae]